MKSLFAAGDRVFQDHVEGLGTISGLFEAAMDHGLEQARFHLHRLELAVEATQEELDDARRDLEAAFEDISDNSGQRIDRLIEEVSRLRDLLERQTESLQTGARELHDLEARVQAAQEELKQAIFRAQVAMTENKARYSAFEAVTHTALSTAGGGAVRPSSVPPGPRSAAFAPGRRLPPLPRGMQWVPVDSLIWDEPPEALVFKKASRDDIAVMMRTFADVIMPMLTVDRNLSADFLARQDAQVGRQTGDPDSLLGTWERLVSGSDPIALVHDHRANGRYGFNSGRHRALVARDMGWTHVPAFVSGSGRGTT